MASNDKDEAEGFLTRWSQRKRTAEREGDRKPAAGTETPGDAAALRARQKGDQPQGVQTEETGPDPAREIDPADLPDIETLGAGDDFSVFMKKGVPEALQRQALRKLWRLNPIFGHLDRLNDYDLDYTNAGTVVENLKTIYQVGKGMVLPEEEEAEKVAESEASDGPTDGEAAVAEDSVAESAAVRDANEAESVEAAPVSKTKDRKPGDPLVSGTPTRRSSGPRSSDRSALRRRWGES